MSLFTIQKNYILPRFSVNMETHLFTLYIDLPKLRIEAHYSVDGKLLVLPVKGDGNLEANISK